MSEQNSSRNSGKTTSKWIVGFLVGGLWLVVCLVAAVVIGLAVLWSPVAVQPQVSQNTAISITTENVPVWTDKNLKQFETSRFCQKYQCIIPETSLDTTNYHPYLISSYPKYNEFFVEILTENGQIINAALTLDPKAITTDELELVELFLESVQPEPVDSTAMLFVENNLSNPVNQICDANSMRIGSLGLWVGSIGYAPTVVAARDCIR